MKLTIISDIRGKSKTVIPYGLELAKQLKSEVDIVHIIDSRTKQGKYSPYADSQSITPGNILSHRQIIENEKIGANKILDKILSKEASKLNYPLKINVTIEEGYLKKKIKELVKADQDSLFLVSSEPDDYNFHSDNEIIQTFKNTGAFTLFVPPEKEFAGINQVLLLINFDLNDITHNISFLNFFKPTIFALDIAENTIEKDKKSIKWFKEAEKYLLTDISIQKIILKGSNYFDMLKNHISNSKHDVVLNLKKKPTLIGHKDDEKLLRRLIENPQLPVLQPF